MPPILNCKKEARAPIRHRCVLATTREKEPEPHKVYPTGQGIPPVPDGLCEKVRRSPLALSPHSPTFSLSANTFSILTEALRNVT